MEEDTKYEKLARKLKEAQEERQIEVHNVYQAKQKLEELEEEWSWDTIDTDSAYYDSDDQKGNPMS